MLTLLSSSSILKDKILKILKAEYEDNFHILSLIFDIYYLNANLFYILII